jgi:aminoglycoside phosphotransferase (APT) family kinase protein
VTRFADAPAPVRQGQGFDTDRLSVWLRERVPDLEGELTVAQFGRGYSNLTYLIRFGDGATARELVLRRPPPGVKIQSAHDMGREYRILSALAPVWPKAPRPLAYCQEEALIGTPFYVMERKRGVILRARLPPELVLDPKTMGRASEALIDTLAEIHLLDYKKAGLGDLGKSEGYVKRQVSGWTDRYKKAQTDDVPQVEELGRWLFANMPKESGATLIHNDFKYDNVVLDDELTEVVAVLDWEMATVGDPLMDLGTALGYWVQADDPPVFQLTVFGPTNLPGSLRRVDLVRRYEEKTGRHVGNVLYYYAYALYKLAVVAQQLYRRYKDGLTKEERYAPMLEGVRAVTTAALLAVEMGRIDRL